MAPLNKLISCTDMECRCRALLDACAAAETGFAVAEGCFFVRVQFAVNTDRTDVTACSAADAIVAVERDLSKFFIAEDTAEVFQAQAGDEQFGIRFPRGCYPGQIETDCEEDGENSYQPPPVPEWISQKKPIGNGPGKYQEAGCKKRLAPSSSAGYYVYEKKKENSGRPEQ